MSMDGTVANQNYPRTGRASGGTPRRIAVVGLSGRFPGGANSPELLWETLMSGRDAVGEASGDRWDLGWHNPDRDRQGRVYTGAGGFLSQIDQFDADFFGISPREAQQIDPQQRLLLELAWEAFESAGIPPRNVAGRKIGVYVGISSNDYSSLAGAGWPDAYSNTGSSFSIAANRVSYLFDLHGPSMAIDTACSSSLVCIHEACQSIVNGECEAALAGGVSVIADIRPWLGFARASMLSPNGRCKSFDASGDGYVRSEGGGLVLLKRLEDAERDGDNILGVILATGVNSDGRTLGLSMPNGDAQEALLREVYDAAGIAPEQVFYVEAHGTGTSVGDPIETGALGRVLGTPRTDGSVCHIGSVKSNIGHLEPASGIAGMTKALLSLKHGEIPANLHFNTPNPKIDFDALKLSVVSESRALPGDDTPVVIGVNSFGFGGTNSHVVLKRYERARTTRTVQLRDPGLLILSGHSEAALRALAASYVALLREPAADWVAIASATAHCRTLQRLRLAVRAQSAAEAADRIEAWLAGNPGADCALGSSNTAHAPTAFIYSGNGPQWWGMGRTLLAENVTFRATVEAVDRIFTPLSGWSLTAEMARPEQESRIHLTEVAQPMLFALQMGVTEALREQGIHPDAVMGHSVGEVAAACVSGALSLEQATQVIYYRSREQASTVGMGKMAAIGLDDGTVAELAAKIGGWLEIAAINGPQAVTVAGDEASLNALVEKVTAEGRFARMLTLDYPFHTRAMDGIRDGLTGALAGIRPGASGIPFISTVTGALRDGESLDADYWFQNVREPVRFHDAVDHLLAKQNVALFIEVGPHPVLRDYILQSTRAAGAQATALQTLRRPGGKGPENDVENLATVIATAHAHGAGRVEALFDRPGRIPDLPTYPWQRVRHWRGAVGLPDIFTPIEKDHPLLGARLPATDGRWEVSLDKNLIGYLRDHVIQGSVLFPAAGYLEQLLSGARLLHGEGILDVESFAIERPLVLTDHADPMVQTVIEVNTGTAEIGSRRDFAARDLTVHVTARVSHAPARAMPRRDMAAIAARMSETVTAEDHYRNAARRGMEYGPGFRGVRSVRLTAPQAERREALAEIRLDFPEVRDLEGHRAHPAILDCCLQTAITLVAQNDKRDVSTIPVHVESVRSHAPLPSAVFCHLVITRESARSVVVDIEMLSPEGDVLLSMKDARCQKANLTGITTSPLTSEWWRPDSAHPLKGPLDPLPSPEELCAAVAALLPAGSGGPAPFAAQLERLATLHAIRVLDSLRGGLAEFDLSALARHARIRRDGTALLGRLIEIAAQAGKLASVGKGWRWLEGAEPETPDHLWAELFRDHPARQAELLLLAEAGDALIARLCDKEEVSANTALVEQLFDTSPHGDSARRLHMAAITTLVANWPARRPMRILELGAGSGGLSAWILPLLPAERADYLLTDPSEEAIGRAERRFAREGFVRVKTLAAGVDPVEQGLPTGYFDLVILSRPERLGKDAAALLKAFRPVMAEGGMVLCVNRPQGAFEALVIDAHLRIDVADARAAGLPDVRALGTDGTACLLCAVTDAPGRVAPVPTVEPRSFLIVAEARDGSATALAETLTAWGHAASACVVPAGQDPRPVLLDALARTCASQVVLLSGGNGSTDLFETQTRRSLTAVALVGAMETARLKSDCALTIVTRGAFSTCDGAGPLDPAEAALWGLGRVIGNEHQGLGLRLVDLHADVGESAATDWLARELLRRDAETEVQIVHGHRFVNRERITSLADEARFAGRKAEAFALDFEAKGGIDSLHLVELDRGAPAAGEVEITVKAAGLNFRDVLWCMGMLPEEAVENGFSGPTIGMECAGEVTRVGEGVEHLAVGDRVVAFASSCFASHVTTDAGSVARLPDGLDFAAAATIPTTFLTAWYGLDHLARLEKGETVLIHGAAGGVGLAAIQIAKLKGARIIGTAGSAIKRRMLELIGVDHVLNSRTLEFADEVMELTQGRGVDVVLNSLAGEAIVKSLNCLRPFGRFLEIGKRDFYANSRVGLRPFRNNLSYFGIDADTLLIGRPELAGRLFAEVLGHFGTGVLRPLPHQVTPISRASEAFRAMQQSRHVGKLVVSLELDRADRLPVVPTREPVRAGGTYLVTGGLGGFGLETARWLVDQGARSLALVSRSGAAQAEAKAAITAWESRGVTVRAFAADVADPDELAAVLGAVRADMPPLIGVIHSAAVIEDAPILNIEAEQLRRVFLPKMVGAWNLHTLTLADPLEMFVLYSSSSAVIGNPGQGAYVAANLYLDALALYRRTQGLPGLAIGWGAIRDAGFLTRHEVVADMLRSRTGLEATPAREALEDLARVSSAGSRRVSVARFDLGRLSQMLPAARVPRFLPIIPSDASSLLSAEKTLADLVGDIPKSEQRGFILERVRENTARVLGTSAAQINPEQALSDLGLDSLMAVELAGMIERDIEQTVPVMQLLGAGSLIEVAEFVARALGVAAEGNAGASTADAPSPVREMT